MTAGIIVGGSALCLILLLGWLWMRGQRTKADLAARYPPPGQMVDQGGYRLHINCQGPSQAGNPTVVIDAASGEFSLHWSAIQQRVAKFTSVCTYDRAGMGWSERSPRPYTPLRNVEELHTLLTEAGVEPPFVLVGHSLGGLNVRLYAHKYPHQVAGIVLVDPTHEDQFARFPERFQQLAGRQQRALPLILRLATWMNTIGLLAQSPALVEKLWSDQLQMLPLDTRDELMGVLLSDTRFFKTMIQETALIEEIMAKVRAVPDTSLGDMPLVVLSAGHLYPPDQKEALKHAGLTAQDEEQVKAVHIKLHAELAALSSNGKQVIAADSGHNIYADQPELVVDAIRQVVEASEH